MRESFAKFGACQCFDPGCPVCMGGCESPAIGILYRVDMHDGDGTAFCQGCYNDAMNSGVFSSESQDGEEDGD